MHPLALAPEAVAELRSHLLLCYTGHVRTDLGLIATQIRMYEEGREDTIVGMKQLQAMAFEMRRRDRGRRTSTALGPMLHEAFESKKRMNPHVAEGTPIDAPARRRARRGGLGRQALRRGRRRLPAARVRARTPARGPLGARGARRPVRGLRVPAPRRRGARGRARVETLVSRRFVLLDRDGTINEEVGYVLRPDELRLIPGAADALRELRDLGLGLVVVTNQSPIGRGMLTVDELDAIHARLARAARRRGRDAGRHRALPAPPGRGLRVPQARRPRIVERAAAALGFDPAESFVVGDHGGDLAMGRAVGARTFLVRTGHGEEELERGAEPIRRPRRRRPRARPPTIIRDEILAASVRP